jgi:regulator of protease activity HflC (stomatin/prohibitin superfamily)
LNQQQLQFQRQSLKWSFLVYLGVLLAYAGFVSTHPSPWLVLPVCFSAGLAAQWIQAFLLGRLQQQKIVLSAQHEHDEQIFEESYEHIVLTRQFQVVKGTLGILATSLNVVGMIVFALIQITDPWQWGPLGSEFRHGNMAFLLFLAATHFVLGRFLSAVDAKSPLAAPSKTVGGLLIYSALAITIFALQVFFSTETFAFIVPWLSWASALAALIYPLELPILSLSHAYGQNKSPLGPAVPKLANAPWAQKIQGRAQNVLQYQFGHDLNSNLKRMLNQHGGPLLLVLFLSMAASNAVFTVPLGHEAIISHWGVLKSEPLAPGLHIKWPEPIETVTILRRRQEKLLTLGSSSKESGSHMWDTPEHQNDLKLILRTPDQQNNQWPIEIISVSAVIRYHISDSKQWIRQSSQPEAILEALALREITDVHLINHREQLLETSRNLIEQQLQQSLQVRCDQLQLGVNILGFTIPQIHPPAETLESFQEAVKSRFQKEATISKAEGERDQWLARIEAERSIKRSQAEAEKTKILADASSLLIRVQLLSKVVATDPELFWARQHLEALPRVTADMHKVLLLSEHDKKVQLLNLESDLEPEMLDLNLEARNLSR